MAQVRSQNRKKYLPSFDVADFKVRFPFNDIASSKTESLIVHPMSSDEISFLGAMTVEEETQLFAAGSKDGCEVHVAAAVRD